MSEQIGLSEQQYQEAVNLTRRALAQARAGQWLASGLTVGSLDHLYGEDGIRILLIGLSDTFLAANGMRRGCAETVVPVFFDGSGQRFELAGEAPPPIRWAGRFLAARAADDKDTAAALIASCRDEEFDHNLFGLVKVVAESLNAMESTR